jgi:hypothetical protein
MRKLVIIVAVLILAAVVGVATARGVSFRNNCAHNVIGDVNDDGVTNIRDFSLLSTSYGKHVGDPGFLQAADLTCDGIVNDYDFQVLKVGYGLPAGTVYKGP